MGASSYPGSSFISIESFSGYQTKSDPTKVSDGANPMGQNTTVNDGDRISIRKAGFEMFPNTIEATSTEQKIQSVHTFRKRSSENILIRTRGEIMEYFEEGNDRWETFRDGLTANKKFGFADYNINTDVQSQVYFGNAYDNAARWTGAHSTLNGAVTIGMDEVVIDSISGFAATGSVMICGASTTYYGIGLLTNILYLTASSTITCEDNRGVAQTVTEYANIPKGNIYLSANNRIFIAGIVSTSQAVYFSEYGNATNYVGADLVTDDTDTAPGIFNLGEGGGAVTGMVQDEESIYIFKKSIIRKATLTDTVYTLTTLKPFDGKGQTVGSKSSKGLFTGGNAVYFTTSDNQIMELSRVETVDYPQIIPISSAIEPTVDQFNFDDSAGIVFKNKAYIALKSNNTVSENDTVLVWNIDKKVWDSPIVGWRVSDWVVYSDGITEDLYFADATSPNIYKVITESNDNGYEVKSNWRSKQYSFGKPYALKEIVDIYVEGYISENTSLDISLLLDEDGYTQVFKTTVKGTDSEYLYNNAEYNTIGLTTFGTRRFGSQDGVSEMKKFRVYLGKDFRASPFYNAQIEFASEGENYNWEVLSYAMKVREYSQSEKRELYKSFK